MRIDIVNNAEDFSEENLLEAGITTRYFNEELDHCMEELSAVIQSY